MLAVAGQTIDTSAYEKVSVGIVCLAKTFINIILTVGDMNTSFGGVEKVCRLTEVCQPSYTFFLFDGNSRRIDSFLERVGALTVRNVMRPFLS
jgi:hypothetical protein